MAAEELRRRREDDPLLAFVPHEKQAAFIDAVLRGPHAENWLLAANRSGKSDAGAYCGATLARFGLEPTRAAYGPSVDVYDRATSGWVVSLDFPSSRDIIQPKYFDNGVGRGSSTHGPFIPAREIERWSVTDQLLKLKNGSLIGFKSADSGRGKFQGVEKDWVHFDEEPPRDIYEECVIRVGAGRRLRVFGTCTLLPPEGVVGGASWLFSHVVQGERKDIGLFGASIYDNPHLDPAEIARLESVYPEGSVQRRIRLLGEWLPGLTGARAYPAFSRSIHVRPLPDPDPRLPLCWALDFNVEPMVSLVGQRIQGEFRVHCEIVLEPGSLPDLVDAFRAEFPTHGAELWIYGDATGRRRTSQTGQSDYHLLLSHLRSYPVPTRLKVPETNPIVRDRVNAVNRALRDENGRVGLIIDPSCRELIADLEQVILDARGLVKKTTNRSDPYFRRTHASDALGYWVVHEAPVSLTAPVRPSLASVRAPQYAWST